jgi:hypothetical protein
MDISKAFICALERDLNSATRKGDAKEAEYLQSCIDSYNSGDGSDRYYSVRYLASVVGKTHLEDWLYRAESEDRVRKPRCRFISDDGTWTHLFMNVDAEREQITLFNKLRGFEKTLNISEEHKTWLSEYRNMELVFVYVG